MPNKKTKRFFLPLKVWSNLKLRRFWVTGSKRNQDLFPFYMPWRHHIWIDKCHYSYRDDLPENLPKNHCPTMQKSPLPVAVKSPYLNQKRHAIFPLEESHWVCCIGSYNGFHWTEKLKLFYNKQIYIFIYLGHERLERS